MKETIRPKNFVGDIHNKDYQEPYRINEFTSKDMIYDHGRAKESLNGRWSFGIDQYDTCLRAKWYEEKYKNNEGMYLPIDYSFEQWERMKVPSCWNTEEEKYLLYEGSVVYTRTFKYSNIGEGRVFIKFGAANYEAKIFLNKKYLGYHKGGSTPFYVEVTGKLEESNRILVVVNNTRKSGNVPSENTDWFNYGGLYRDVEIIRVAETFIKDFYIRLMPDSNFEKVRADVQVDGNIQNGKAILEIEELNLRKEIEVEDCKGYLEFDAKPELWCPDNPKLYTIKVIFGEDSITDKIGFREIKTEGTDILLNGQKIFLKGICSHEESVENGKAIKEAEIVENIKLAKEMNCNYMRLAHYPHTEKAAKLADEMGIMLWEEIPVYWAIDFENEITYKDAENQLSELILRDRNRASVIIWSVGNENADTDARLEFMSSLAKKAKVLDATRLVSAACMVDHQNNMIADRLAEFLDVIGINEYCGWYTPDFGKLIELFQNSKPEKPVIISEFGADARAGERGSINDLGSEDCQENVFKMQVETLGKIPYVKGTSPWILYDFRCPRRLHYLQNYYNTKGMLSADKKYKKPAFYVMKKFYSTKD
jgi:beta-glucuronidase